MYDQVCILALRFIIDGYLLCPLFVSSYDILMGLYLSCLWFISPSLILSNFVNVVPNYLILFFLVPERCSIVYMYQIHMCMYMYHNFYVCLYFGAIRSSAGAQSLLLCMPPGISPDGAWRIIRSAGDLIWASCM